MADLELLAVQRPFDSAFLRMCQAGDVDLLRDELSNLLQHHYRLGELCARRWGLSSSGRAYTAKVRVVRGVLGMLWIRTYDTHEIAEVAELGDLVSNYVTELVGVLVWKPTQLMPFLNQPNDARRYTDYLTIEGKSVLDTSRRAFDGLAAML